MFGGGLEGPGLLIIFGIIVLLFGGSKLPQLARGLGRAKVEFDQASNGSASAAEDVPSPDEKVQISRADYEELLRGQRLGELGAGSIGRPGEQV